MLPTLTLLRILAGAVAVAATLWPALATAQAVVTILDGEAKVVHPKGSFAAIEGMKLPPSALVNVGAKAQLLRLEWPDGSAVDLGPATMAMVLAARISEKAPKAPGVYVLRGTAKISAKSPAGAPAVVSPGLDIPPFAGVAVLQAAADRTGLFAESGSVLLHERGATAPVQLPAGQFWARAGAAAGSTQPRPPGDWLAQLPRAYRDTLPLRREVVLARNVQAKPLPLPPYAELRDWLHAEPLVRRALVTQFTAWAQDPGMKSALIANINDHREWGYIVLPPPPKPELPRPASPPPASGQRTTP